MSKKFIDILTDYEYLISQLLDVVSVLELKDYGLDSNEAIINTVMYSLEHLASEHSNLIIMHRKEI